MDKKKVDEPAFVVEFKCSNCGNQWKREFSMGVRVDSPSMASLREIHIYTDEKVGYEILKCPVCGLKKEIFIQDRYPKKDEALELRGEIDRHRFAKAELGQFMNKNKELRRRKK